MSVKLRKIFLLLCIAACLAFIWINSSLNADASGRMSRFVEHLFNFFLRDKSINEAVIRKLAHGFEFFMLGTIVTLFWFEKPVRRLPLIELIGMSTALCDETIQLFSPGRTSQVKDIWIDFSGYTAGTFAVLILYALFSIMKGKNKNYENKD